MIRWTRLLIVLRYIYIFYLLSTRYKISPVSGIILDELNLDGPIPPFIYSLNSGVDYILCNFISLSQKCVLYQQIFHIKFIFILFCFMVPLFYLIHFNLLDTMRYPILFTHFCFSDVYWSSRILFIVIQMFQLLLEQRIRPFKYLFYFIVSYFDLSFISGVLNFRLWIIYD